LEESLLNKYKGCLLGLAVGDALGAAVEFMSSFHSLVYFSDDAPMDGIQNGGRLFGL